MKKSKAITLVLLTSTLLLGCGEDEKMRNKYGSWDDCVADYKDPAKCEAGQEKTTAGMRHYYYGPWYTASHFSSSRYNPGYSSARTVGITRSGFGSSGHSSGS
ncbi:MAG: hypothetical protein ACYDHW_08820 [Syntrophorhabdaceae bacterium]